MAMHLRAEAFLDGLRSVGTLRPSGFVLPDLRWLFERSEGDALHSDWKRLGGDFTIALTRAEEHKASGKRVAQAERTQG